MKRDIISSNLGQYSVTLALNPVGSAPTGLKVTATATLQQGNALVSGKKLRFVLSGEGQDQTTNATWSNPDTGSNGIEATRTTTNLGEATADLYDTVPQKRQGYGYGGRRASVQYA
jgi:hypothetical protein